MNNKKVCLKCKKEFPKPYKYSQKQWINEMKYCSSECRSRKVILNCSQCNKEITKTVHKVKKHNYCNNNCKIESTKRRITITCVVCGNSKELPISVIKKGWGKCCSPKCFHTSRIGIYRGEKCPAWKGGFCSLTKIVRGSLEYKLWRKAILKRDNYSCQICGDTKSEFNVDHYPKSLAQLLSENKIKTTEEASICNKLWSLKNGRTLCVSCHRKTPTYLKPLNQHPIIN